MPAEGAASFQRAKEAADAEVAARVREWSKVTQILDGVAYIPLRHDHRWQNLAEGLTGGRP